MDGYSVCGQHSFLPMHECRGLQNEAKMMNTDGSGLVYLWDEQSSADDGSYNDPNLSFTQDTQDFALQALNNNQQEILTFGSTNGGSTTTFATPTGAERLTIIGWT